MKLKFISMLMIGALALSFSGCGSSQEAVGIELKKKQEKEKKREERRQQRAQLREQRKQAKLEEERVFAEKKKQLDALLESEKILAVKKNPQEIMYMSEPSKEVQIQAAKQMPLAVAKYVKNIVPEAQVMIVNHDAMAIGYISNPTEEVQLIAINKDPISCMYIQNPTGLAAKKCSDREKFQNQKIRHNFLKDIITPTLAYFEVGDNLLTARIYAVDGTANVTNHTNNFIKLLSFSVYYGEDIYTKKINISLPPVSETKFQSLSTQTIMKSFYIPVKSYEQTLNVGIAIEYEVNGKRQTFYKTKVVTYKEN